MNRQQKINTYTSWCEKTAANDVIGYDNRINHNLGPNGYDCGTFISYGLQEAGLLPSGVVFEPNQPDGEWGYDTILTEAGFTKYPFNEGNLQRGDILIQDGHHTEIYLGSGMQLGAHDNYDGVEGDGSGSEISRTPMYHNFWDYIYRLEEDENPAPVPEKTSNFIYQVMDDMSKSWLPNVVNDSDYAGIFGSDVDNVYINCTDGNVTYCVHRWTGDGVENYPGGDWLPWVKNREDFAGFNTPIDAIAIKSDIPCMYQVHLRKMGGWLEPVLSENCNLRDHEYGYAGIIGEPIDALIITPLK